MCQAGQRRELRRLVEHGVAGQQRRHEHVAADEIRVVPRRDVGDDAERLVRDALVELCAASSNTFSSRSARADSARKKSMRGRAGPSARCATGGSACRPPASASWPASRSRATTQLAKALDRVDALGAAASPPTRAARRAPLRTLRGDARAASSAATLGDQRAGGGIDDLQRRRRHRGLRFAARARRRGIRRASARRRACSSPMPGSHELRMPLHAERRSSARASGSPRRCRPARRSASTTKPARQVLHRLVVDRVDDRASTRLRIELGQPRARHELERVEVARRRCRQSRWSSAPGICVRDVLVERAAERDVDQLAAAADAEHRLAACRRTPRSSSIS